MSLTALVFVIAFVGALGMALFRNPVFGLYAYVATFYLHPQSRWWGNDLPDLRWSLIAAALTLIAVLLRQQVSPTTDSQAALPERSSWLAGPGWILLLFTLWLWIQLGWALWTDAHIELAVLFSKYVVLLFLMHRLLIGPQEILGFVAAHVLGCLYIGWLIMDLPGSSIVAGRLPAMGGPGIGSANYLASQLVTGLVCAGALLLCKSWKWRIIALLAIPLIANGIIQASSRGAFLGLVAAGVVVYALSVPRHRRILAILAVLGVAVVVARAPDHFIERMKTIAAATGPTEEMDSSAASRLVFIEAQLAMFRQYPHGTGHRGTMVLSPLYLDEQYLISIRGGADEVAARASHNMTMTLLAEHGVPGLLLFALLPAWALGQSWRLYRALRDARASDDPDMGGIAPLVPAVIGCLAALFVAAQFSDFIRMEAIIWYLALLAALGRLVKARQPVAQSEQPGATRFRPAQQRPAAT